MQRSAIAAVFDGRRIARDEALARAPPANGSGLAGAILVGSVVALVRLAELSCTEFNLYVMLRSVCVSLLVAFAQMITLAVGQMNLAVGALGGLVAIAVRRDVVDVFGLPLWLAMPLALLIGLLGGLLNGLLIDAHGHQRLHHHAGDAARPSPASISGSPSQSPSTTCRAALSRLRRQPASARFPIC